MSKYHKFMREFNREKGYNSFYGSNKKDFQDAWERSKGASVKPREAIVEQKPEPPKEEPKKEPENEDIISGNLQKLIYTSSIDKIKKSLIDLKYKGRMNTNKILLNMQLLQNLDINKQKELIKLLE